MMLRAPEDDVDLRVADLSDSLFVGRLFFQLYNVAVQLIRGSLFLDSDAVFKSRNGWLSNTSSFSSDFFKFLEISSI